MAERPILFNAPMVRSILAGTKSQTRRVMSERHRWHFIEYSGDLGLCPYGQPGDRLWVREAHSIGPGPDVHLEPGETAGALRWPHVTYTADGAVERRDMRWKGAFGVGRPSIHMPRWASRITLEVTGVRVERLQDISTADCWAEGIAASPDVDPVHEYGELWEQINGPGSWDANPWLWVVEFRRLPC